MPFPTLRSSARTAIHGLGIVHAFRALKRRGCRILIYHRFPPDHSQLAAQCEHLRRYYHPVSMRQVAESVCGGPPLPNNAVTVTIDDGYRDFMPHGHPVFSQYEVPATVFLITGFIDRELWPWWDHIHYLLLHTRQTKLSFAGQELGISGDLDRLAFRVGEMVRRLPATARIAKVKELQRLLEVDLPSCIPAEYEPLSWDDVRRLSTLGVEFGGHTRSHPILSQVSDAAELETEIAGSKKRLDEELGFPSLHFAYPYGTHNDYDDHTVAMVRKSGFTAAVTTARGFNYAGAVPHELRRIGVDPSLPEKRFVELLAGIRKV